ncbi:MAG: hypothetical protein PHN49_10435 [Candidatus Omnitrophica bacterium]|nr:hypothetical protein [Candidatus Omnitrophota bacterium]MDD5672047.1 hypothetical protein [Candidatus Omnitrophota bacterium]
MADEAKNEEKKEAAVEEKKEAPVAEKKEEKKAVAADEKKTPEAAGGAVKAAEPKEEKRKKVTRMSLPEIEAAIANVGKQMGGYESHYAQVLLARREILKQELPGKTAKK